MSIDIYTFSHVGGQAENQDNYLVSTKGEKTILALGDGLGGRSGGRIASQLTIDYLKEKWDTYNDNVEWQAWLEQATAEVNDLLLAKQIEMHNAMKTTLICAVIEESCALWSHVGDSRLYYFSQGELVSVTEDHSVTYKKYKSGEIRRVDMNFDEDRSSLLRVVGDKKTCVADIVQAPVTLQDGDGILLCSDGFWEYLYDTEILIDYLKASSASNWAEMMMLRLMERVKPDTDNMTFIAAIYHRKEKDVK